MQVPLKLSFFEVLLKEIQQRLFEGSEWPMLPVKDSSKGLLFQLAGIIVSHFIVEGGPSFSALCPAIYFYLADADPLYVLSQRRRYPAQCRYFSALTFFVTFMGTRTLGACKKFCSLYIGRRQVYRGRGY